MSPEFSTALSLMAVGMITVFVVLLLVVITGRVLTFVVNKSDESANSALAPAKIAAISAAVEAFTQGKGHITKIGKE